MKLHPGAAACLTIMGLTGSGLAQGAAGTAHDFLVQVWDVERGLPYSSVSSIAQTPDGYLWVGTFHGGLARFDGARFVTFHPGNTPEMSSMEVQRLLVDPEGTLWIGLVEGVLLSRRDGRFQFERSSTLTPESWLDNVLAVRSNEVMLASLASWIYRGVREGDTRRWETFQPPEHVIGLTTVEDRDGTVWFQRPDWKVGWWRQGQWELPDALPGLQDPHIMALARDGAGRIWVGTPREIAVWEGSRFVNMTPTNGPPSISIRQMVIGPAGEIWVRTEEGFRQSRDRQWRIVVEPTSLGQRTDLHPIRMHPDGRDGLWLARFTEGLWYLDEHGRLAKVGREQGLPSDAIEAFFLDREGNAWVGLSGGGLASVRRRTVHALEMDETTAGEPIRSVCEDRDGDLWLGTAGNHVWRVRDGEVMTLTLPIERAAAQATIAYPDREDRLWIGSVQNGVWLWETNALRRPFPLDAVGTVARVFLQDRAGRIWIGNEFGLYCWEDEQLKQFGEEDGFAPSFVLSLAEDRGGILWMGTGRGELRSLHNGRFRSYRPPDRHEQEPRANDAGRGRGALTGFEQFWALYPDADGVLWIGTLGGGLLRFKDGQFSRFTTREGLPNEHVSQILEDADGHLWLGTRGGLVRVSKQALTAFAQGRVDSVAFTSYGRFDGMPTIECSGGMQPACWRGRDGRLWFSTVKGAVWVDPGRVPFNALPPPVLIEGFWVDNRLRYAREVVPDGRPEGGPEVRDASRLRIPAGQHYFEIAFTALSFTAPDKVRFQWRLLGGDRPLAGEGEDRSVNFSHLAPGRYEFRVTACNNDGVWNEQGATLAFTVLPHFYQQWWFKLAVAAAAAGLLLAIYSVRIARLRALERLRLRIARDLHDEVGSNLGSMSLLAQVMEQHPSAEDARELRGIAAQTVDTLRDVVWFIDPAHERLSDLVARMAETARAMLHGVSYDFGQTGDFRASRLPLDFRRNVLPIFKEALHNAVRHSGATHLRIQVSQRGDRFQFSVADNGSGRVPKEPHAGNGLKNMRRRAAEMKGELELRAEPGRGTTVSLTARLR